MTVTKAWMLHNVAEAMGGRENVIREGEDLVILERRMWLSRFLFTRRETARVVDFNMIKIKCGLDVLGPVLYAARVDN